MRQISAISLIPVGALAFLGGAALVTSRRGLSMLPPSEGPIAGVPIVAWQRFVTIMAVAPKNHISPRGRTGMFGMDARRLCDVGLMVSARKAAVAGESGVWVGEWKKPLTSESFLASTPLQYEAFKRSMARMSPKVRGLVGTSIDGTRATLSGLLGVGHLAGEEGTRSWVEDPRVRARFSATTKNFHRCNGIF